MAELFDVLDKELLDVDVGVGVVLSHGDAQETFWPCDQSSFGELGSQNGLRAFSKSGSVKDHLVVVEVQKGLGILEHLVDCITFFFWKSHHLVFSIFMLQDLAHRVRLVGRAVLDNQLHSSKSLFCFS